MRHLIFALTMAAVMPASGHVWDELAILARGDSDGEGFILEKYPFLQPTSYSCALFFDYNNDGNLDLLLMGKGGDWNVAGSQRFLLLYENLGENEDYRFRKVADTGLRQAVDEAYLNPVSAGDFNHDGYTDLAVMSHDGRRHVEIYLNEKGSGHFTRHENCAEAATNGGVMWGDINNDGWLDLVYSGYSDRSATEMQLLLNDGNGILHEATPANLSGAFQGGCALADLNGNGLLDIISTGNKGDWGTVTSLFYNSPAAPGLKFTKVEASECGLPSVSRATPLVADFNADGFTDIVLNGEGNDGSGFRTRICYRNQEGIYSQDTSYPVIAVNQDGGINMGDYDGDGNMDLIVGGYVGNNDGKQLYSAPLCVYRNDPALAGVAENKAPTAPSNVGVEVIDGKIVLSWSPGSDTESAATALRYSLFVKNRTTGECYTMIPADIATGRLLVGTDLQTSLSSTVNKYTMSHFGQGEYVAGVQTLDQAYAPSAFTTVEFTIGNSGIAGEENDSCAASLSVNGDEVTVNSRAEELVRIFTPDGRNVAVGSTNIPVPLSKGDIYIITTPTFHAKVRI